jgi:hypothetical protein
MDHFIKNNYFKCVTLHSQAKRVTSKDSDHHTHGKENFLEKTKISILLEENVLIFSYSYASAFLRSIVINIFTL